MQLSAGGDPDANFAQAERLIREAAAREARLVVLPEVFLWRGAQEREVEIAQPIPGPTSTRLGELARELGILLVAGSILETASAGRAFNTSILFAADGRMQAAYRKIHLFDVDIPPHVRVRESDSRAPGSDVVCAATELGAVGLSICYDLRFPELYRRLAAAGARILCVPAAFTFATGSAHWEVLLRARAIENQAYVIAANQFGQGMGGVMNFGNSMIVDPWGTVVARCGGDGAQVVDAVLDMAHLERVRAQLPALEHIRIRDRAE